MELGRRGRMDRKWTQQGEQFGVWGVGQINKKTHKREALQLAFIVVPEHLELATDTQPREPHLPCDRQTGMVCARELLPPRVRQARKPVLLLLLLLGCVLGFPRAAQWGFLFLKLLFSRRILRERNRTQYHVITWSYHVFTWSFHRNNVIVSRFYAILFTF